MASTRGLTTRIAGLDLLRSAAVLLVVLYHYPVHPPQFGLRVFFDQGWTGVDLFFVLSGFLIGGQLFQTIASDRPFNMARFMGRRLFRTLPNYWFVLFAFYVLWPAQPFGTATPLWRYLLFTQNFFGMSAFIPSWSLCIEEHFYLVFPVLVLLLLRKAARKRWLPAVGLAVMATLVAEALVRACVWLAVRPDLAQGATFDEQYKLFFDWIEYPTLTHLDGITIGVGMSAIRVFRPALWQRLELRKHSFLVLGAALLLLSAVLNHHHRSWPASVFGYSLLAAGFGAWLIPAYSQKTFPKPFELLFQKVAELSFAIYLLTEPVLQISTGWVRDRGYEVGGWQNALAFTGLVLATSLLLHHVIEKPALYLRDRYYPAEQKTVQPAVAQTPG